MTGPWEAQVADAIARTINPDAVRVHRLDYAIAAAGQVAADAVNAENRALRELVTELSAKFEASQALADQAIKERDEWHRLAVESDREVERLRASLPPTTGDFLAALDA